MFAARLRKLRVALADKNVDAFLVLNRSNIFYLTGYSGALSEDFFALVVTPSDAVFLVDSRYLEDALVESAVDVARLERRSFEEIGIYLPEGAKRLGFEPEVLTVAQHENLSTALKGIELITVSGISSIRKCKDEGEIEQIAKAAAIADAAFEHVLGLLAPGITEREVALEIDYFMRKKGADKASFDPIVASGARSAIPHAKVTDKPISQGDLVVLDMGARCAGYCSDMTRTVVVGKPNDKQREMYRIVREAQAVALERVRAGAACRELDALARDRIERAGFEGKFLHGLGHGVGIEVHEIPVMSKESADVLEAAEVITVEPAIYVSGIGGVRIEDLVLVSKEGSEVLSRSPKDLIEV